MNILTIDSAKNVKNRGWSLWRSGDPSILHSSGNGCPPVCKIDWVVGEIPFISQKLRGQGLITFAMNNGWQIRDASNDPTYGYSAIPVADWKRTCFPGRERVPKKVFTNLLAREFAPTKNPDQLDAIGIGWAAVQLGQAFLEKWRIS